MTSTQTDLANALKGADDPATVAALVLRGPKATDAVAVARLIAAAPPLDRNSLYCTLLQCSHFADSCLLAEQNRAVVGWVSGYRLPQDPEILFVWQVAVDATARGQGLGRRMLDALINRPGLAGVKRLIATITPSNTASRRMFAGFAARHGLALDDRAYFERDAHFGGAHETEHLVSIGPIDRRMKGSP